MQRAKSFRSRSRVFGGIVGGIARALPLTTYSVDVTLFGNPNATQAKLLDAAQDIQQYVDRKLGLDLGATELNIQAGFTEPIVQVQYKVTAGPVAAPYPQGPYDRLKRLETTLNGRLRFPVDSFIEPYPGNQPVPARGTTLKAIIAAELHTARTTPKTPVQQARDVEERNP